MTEREAIRALRVMARACRIRKVDEQWPALKHLIDKALDDPKAKNVPINHLIDTLNATHDAPEFGLPPKKNGDCNQCGHPQKEHCLGECPPAGLQHHSEILKAHDVRLGELDSKITATEKQIDMLPEYGVHGVQQAFREGLHSVQESLKAHDVHLQDLIDSFEKLADRQTTLEGEHNAYNTILDARKKDFDRHQWDIEAQKGSFDKLQSVYGLRIEEMQSKVESLAEQMFEAVGRLRALEEKKNKKECRVSECMNPAMKGSWLCYDHIEPEICLLRTCSYKADDKSMRGFCTAHYVCFEHGTK